MRKKILFHTLIFLSVIPFLTGCHRGGKNREEIITTQRRPDLRELSIIEQSQLREDAINLLLEATRSPDAETRANAIEALQPVPARIEKVLRAGLHDENPGVRFVAAMTTGKLRMKQLTRTLRPLLRDENKSVRAAAIYALYNCGANVDISPLSALLMSPDPSTRSNVALVLGEMGNPSALPMLREAAGLPLTRSAPADAKRTRLQIAEAMAKLGDNDALEQIRAALHLPADQGELQAFAASMLGRLGDERSVDSLILLTARRPEYLSAEVRLACAGSLAELGRPQGAFIADAFRDNPRPALRAQAAFVYGEIGDKKNLAILQQMMQDPVSVVRIYAASSIVRITSQ
ncbi:MAG TPA: HEAT repeat domain-containing protein [Phycisphaeraceae bacterium]|nr:HEAT repeat domain-containing protein [Phycisphaeraceae bacterium]